MKSLFYSILGGSLLFLPSIVFPSEELVLQKGCVTCHAMNEKRVGPPFEEIAKKYSEKNLLGLIKSIREGSQGKWGEIPMPRQSVSDAEAKVILEWILSLKKQ
jgi:cytochrome c